MSPFDEIKYCGRATPLFHSFWHLELGKTLNGVAVAVDHLKQHNNLYLYCEAKRMQTEQNWQNQIGKESRSTQYKIIHSLVNYILFLTFFLLTQKLNGRLFGYSIPLTHNSVCAIILTRAVRHFSNHFVNGSNYSKFIIN